MTTEPSTPTESILDVRHLPPPEPLVRALDAIAQLGEGQSLIIRAPREPIMLYPHLKQRNLNWQTIAMNAGDWQLRITQA